MKCPNFRTINEYLSWVAEKGYQKTIIEIKSFNRDKSKHITVMLFQEDDGDWSTLSPPVEISLNQ